MLKLKTFRHLCVCLFTSFCIISSSYAQQVIHIPLIEGDATYAIRQALEHSTSSRIKVILEKGTYFCRPDFAQQKYMAITNHGNGLKNILFSFADFESVEIEGNGATILCHGQLLPFLFEECKQVKVNALTVNWDIPFTFLGEVMAVNKEEGWRDIKPMREGFSWKLEDHHLLFPNIDGFNYHHLGSTLSFDKATKRVNDGAKDIESNPTKVEQLPNGYLRFYEKLSYYPPVGTLLSSKGDRGRDRYAPAFEFKECSGIDLSQITIHHALGMGFLFERSSNICLKDSRVVLPPHTQRVVSTTADATHFANCKGDILIENCIFENMLDDGTNVHGIYVTVNKILSPYTVRVSMNHFEQKGFKCMAPGDEVWLIHQPSPDRASVHVVDKVRALNDTYVELTFKQPLPKATTVGDVVENKTWNPTFTMRGCTIRNHRARSIILKTPCKILIANNHFSSMMSSVHMRGDSFFWFESGAVTDVIIRNNKFTDCVTCGSANQALLFVSPRLGKQFDTSSIYNRNIRFEDNEIVGTSSRIVWVDRVENLQFKRNKIHFQADPAPVFPAAPIFEFTHCKDLCIEGNVFTGKVPEQVLKVDDASRSTLKVRKNKNIKFKVK